MCYSICCSCAGMSHSISMRMPLVPVSITSRSFLLNVRFTISFPEVFAFLKKQKPLLGTRLSALRGFNFKKKNIGMQYRLVKKTKIHASFN